MTPDFIVVNDTVNSWAILVHFLCGLFCSVCIFILCLLQTLLELFAWRSKLHSNSNMFHISNLLPCLPFLPCPLPLRKPPCSAPTTLSYIPLLQPPSFFLSRVPYVQASPSPPAFLTLFLHYTSSPTYSLLPSYHFPWPPFAFNPPLLPLFH